MEKEKIIEFLFEVKNPNFNLEGKELEWTQANVVIPLKEIISKILPELKEEHDEWLKGGWHKKTNKWKASEFQDFIEFLEEKYGSKKKKIR